MRDFIKKEIEKVVGKADFDVFKSEKFGDYSSNVAMVLGKDAKEIAQKIKSPYISKIEVAGPGFLNFWLKPEIIQKKFKEIFKKVEKWGEPEKSFKKIVVIDYSAPNIAKPMNIGHLRSTIIGQALYNIFKFRGWKTISDNHLGDWGTQFGILIAGFKKSELRDKKDLQIDDLMKVYVDYSEKIKEDPELEKEARLETKKLQEGDKENKKIWENFYKITLKYLEKIYKVLGVKFDYSLGESFYQPFLADIVKDAIDQKIAEKSEGAIIIKTSDNQPPFLIQKSDGSFLYSTTDLATIKFRIKKFKPDLILYVVANEQALHFDQLFKAAELLDYSPKTKMVHVKFGMMLSPEGKKFSTRKGRYVGLESVIEEAIERAGKINKETAEIVGIGALKYNDLSQNRLSDIVFDWDKMLSMEGNSAPYLQYTHTRLKSILRKKKISSFDPGFLNNKRELKIILLLDEFPDILEDITNNYCPNYLADYLYRLAKEANSFYETLPVLKAEKGIVEARLALIFAVSNILKIGLNLLGISAPEKM